MNTKQIEESIEIRSIRISNRGLLAELRRRADERSIPIEEIAEELLASAIAIDNELNRFYNPLS
jgi:hypothetical protein